MGTDSRNGHGLQFEIRPVEVEHTYGLRSEILRPGAPLEEVQWPSDTQPGTLHVGCLLEGEVVGIASVHREEPTWLDDHVGGWRLRGMATAEVVRRRGVGRWMLATAMQHILEQGGTLLWCNARTPAVPFYERMGLVAIGEEFDIPGAGPHYVMWCEISPPEPEQP